jgi:superfamily II DNA or RNA helicase
MEARPYQQTLIDDVREAAKKHRKILIVLPTGGGKTVISTLIILASQAKQKICWFVVHRVELVAQTSRTFTENGIDHGIIAAGQSADLTMRVQICMVTTLANRIEKMPVPDMIFFDEAHHCAAKTWQKISSLFPNAFHLGLTATPQRRDKKGLGEFFDIIVEGPPLKWLIKNEYLSEYRIFQPIDPDLDQVRIIRGDFEADKLAEIMAAKPIMGSALEWYRKHLDGKRALAFYCNIANSEALVRDFTAAGIPAAHVDGETPKLDREKIIRQFRDGEILVMSNVGLFGEGFDVPAAEGMIDLGPTTSLSAYLQRCGRVLRKAPGKTAIILDHAGNMKRHGPPHIDRIWSLNPAKSSKDEVPQSKTCPQCMCGLEAVIMVCPVCFYEFPPEEQQVKSVSGGGEEKKTLDTDMTEFIIDLDAKIEDLPIETIAKMSYDQASGMCKSLNDFKKVGQARGYKHQWAGLQYDKHRGIISNRSKWAS